MKCVCVLSCLLLLSPSAVPAHPPSGNPTTKLAVTQRLFYVSTNLLVQKNVEQLEDLMRRAAKSGYTAMVIADTKFGRLAEMDPPYFKNIARVKKLAGELKLEIIPCVFPIGWSSPLLAHDPNLVEGLPVRDALFVVRDNIADISADPPVSLRGGDMTDLSKWDWKDANVVADEGTARAIPAAGENSRLVQKVKVSPYRQYHLSVRVKTDQFAGTPEIKVLTKQGPGLQFAHLDVKPTQGLTVQHVVFNSLDNTEVTIYLGVWDARGLGTLWWDDAKLEEVGLLNVIRRDGAPVLVKTDDGRTLEEGVDYEKITDPRMGTVPWKGEVEVYHAVPRIKLIKPLPDGTRLRVSFYHAITTDAGKTMICPSEPKTVDLLRDQAKRVHAAWGAKAYFMQHDEIRVLNQCDACRKRGLDAGAILADNVKTCIAILKEVNPAGRIYVWSDMFDPAHNAHNDYYLVRGDLAKSWDGLDKDIVIVLWHFQKRDDSFKFFAQRGNPLVIAGYYDVAPEKVSRQVRDWLDSASKLAPDQTIGIMHTTWRRNYRELEAFNKNVDAYLKK